jgi:hypothetical protein
MTTSYKVTKSGKILFTADQICVVVLAVWYYIKFFEFGICAQSMECLSHPSGNKRVFISRNIKDWNGNFFYLANTIPFKFHHVVF